MDYIERRLPLHSAFNIFYECGHYTGFSNTPFCRLRRLGEEEGARTPRAPAQGETPFAIPFFRRGSHISDYLQ